MDSFFTEPEMFNKEEALKALTSGVSLYDTRSQHWWWDKGSCRIKHVVYPEDKYRTNDNKWDGECESMSEENFRKNLPDDFHLFRFSPY